MRDSYVLCGDRIEPVLAHLGDDPVNSALQSLGTGDARAKRVAKILQPLVAYLIARRQRKDLVHLALVSCDVVPNHERHQQQPNHSPQAPLHRPTNKWFKFIPFPVPLLQSDVPFRPNSK